MSGADDKAASDKVTVAFQGERGAFSEMAALGYFQGRRVKAIACRRFRDVFEMVLRGQAKYGILPVENSLTGSVHENYDLFIKYPDVQIAGEHIIRIEHNLIGLPGTSLADIRQVFSHPQALMQCAEFLDSLRDIQQIPFYDTAGSVAHIAEKRDATSAAIAGKEAARHHGLAILAEGIETNRYNYTRFFVMCRVDHPGTETVDKGSVVFTVPNEPGALFKCLSILADRGINMTKLESRPIHGKPWEYMFYADFMLPARDEDFESALKELGNHAENLRVLGLYKG